MNANREYIKVLAVDLDGVLVDSFQVHTQGWLCIMFLLGKSIDVNLCSDLRGIDTVSALSILLRRLEVLVTEREFNLLVNVKNAIRDYEIEKLNHSHINNDIVELIKQAMLLNWKVVCLATSKASETILNKLGLINLFDDVFFGSQINPPKNLSASFLETYLSNARIPKLNCLFIDDGLLPIEHASKVGIPSILFTDESKINGNALVINSFCGRNLNQLYLEAAILLENNVMVKLPNN